MNTNVTKIDENQIEDFDLIATEIVDGNEVQVIKSARKFYEVLGFNPTQWSRWYKGNIENNPFAIQDVDFEAFDIMSNGNLSKDFKLSIDFGERLAMMARTEKGEEIRRYFQRERDAAKKMREQVMSSPSNLSRMDILKLAVAAEEENLKLKQEIEVQEKKNEELECMVIAQDRKLENKSVYEDIGRRFVKTDETRAIQFVAKKHNMTSYKLNKFLESKGIQHKSKEDIWILNSPYDKKGYAKLVEIPCENGYIATVLEWTRTGEAFISNELEKFKKDSFKTQLIPLNQNSSFIH